MTPTTKFALYGGLLLASLSAGYWGRRQGVLKEQWARPIHTHVWVVWSSLAYMLSNWYLPIHIQTLWVYVLMLIVPGVPTLLVGPIAARLRLPPAQIGVMIIAVAIANTGVTLGGYLCYMIFHPGEVALGYGSTIAAINSYLLVLMVYPLLHHYGQSLPGDRSLGRIMWESVARLPALPMYFAIAGWVLAAFVPPPAFILDYHLIDITTIIICVGIYLGIGLNLRLGQTWQYRHWHLVLAACCFVIKPAVMAASLWLTRQTPWPLDPLATKVLLVESFMPAGVSTVMVANMFHLDARLAGNVWLWNTLAFLLVVLPVVLFFVH